MATPATTIRLLACFAVAACLLMVHSGSRLVSGPERIRSGKLEQADEEVGALRRQLEAARAEAAAAATEARAATRRAEAAEAAEAKALAQAAAAALPRRTASSGPGEGLSGLEEANGRLLSRDDILARVPVGQPAFFTVANSAYADLAENWALLLRPLLRGTTAGHMFVASLDGALATRLLARRLPTLRVGLGSNDTGRAPPQSKAPPVEVSANFRLKFSMFRAYGVTKADLIVWLLRAGRPAVVSDVDCAWLSRPQASVSGKPGENDCDHGCAGAVDDQLTFNQIVAGSPTKGKGEPIYPLRAAGDGGRVVFDGSHRRKIGPVSARVICSGHVFHVQQAVRISANLGESRAISANLGQSNGCRPSSLARAS
ncbi:hypothetical protein EMIHUDRAFT_120513 [Emiliania huxleyi CCMP1516]|uniref:Nucleotide-diphospho-sugar transferase domain-containing protein n=2 Tax=Emiliania huxleyi TaxID=2903 RepID=A0A0D3IH66_EMIH1|nr:hypothetical protein EMIHUDRAFT_120513 [Emiliania huxleyi CCMP1516]EOD10601.1 hypothetical protein EMIHUDRAFT_120513 [Emiliania huxleyi CCMP1516]|eukprot:XP_005763030.1 hypothetical protein EMIHUDRAFT_120513 [Emiliania huxleyi CCMP1516]